MAASSCVENAEEIKFNPSIALIANTQYLINAPIAGPLSWHGQSGQAHIKHSGVKFSFTTITGPTNVEGGQFSEFVFTLN